MSGTYTGRTFGDFVVREPIGHGGSGEVYRAEQLALGREAVIKVLLRQDSAGGAERFLREARLASRLDHPYAAHVYAFGSEPDGVLWIAMELVRGTPLDQVLEKQGPIPLARFVPLFDRLCEVLNAAHEQRIIHRDIKPANVMVLQRAGRLMPKLLDLGIARAQPTVQDSQGISTSTPMSTPSGLHETQHEATHNRPAEATTSLPPDGKTNLPAEGKNDLLTQSDSLVLTHVGGVVGTPHYMAPEQWVDASGVDARTDVYALSILAYQCLTGRMPFSGKTVRALALAHATKPLPPLREWLSSELYDVLAKAAAKMPDQRFASALEFASALRQAAGLQSEATPLPQLDAGVRENVLAEAPQPIAEAVALLDSAHSAAQGVVAVRAIVTTFVRYLAVIALSARMRVGAGQSPEAAQVIELLRLLAQQGLETSQWLALVKAFLQPFADRREAHPVPELVRFFDASTGATGALALEELVSLDPPGKDALDDAANLYLHRAVPLVSKLLEAASFLYDYTLVVQRLTPERWMGTRRASRINASVESALQKNQVALVDGVGLPVLELTPFAQLIAPGGGAPEEVFFLDGPGRHGARLVALPTGLERQDPSVWGLLASLGLDVDPRKNSPDAERPPYLGLTSFSAGDADNFFGREHESEAFANRLRSERLLAVVGPSGTGKSSFVLAGVLPLLPAGWRALVFRPGSSPLVALNAMLVSAGFTLAPNDAAPALAADVLASALPPETTCVLVIDQFEELVTLCQDQAVRDDFATRLLAYAEHASGRLRVVITLRDDFLMRVLQLAVFRERLSNALQLLATPEPADLMRVVTEPARRVGYGFDDPALPQQMVEAVAQTPGALALLSFTASQLWELRDRHLRLMRGKAYEALGGVGGALAHHAEATMAAFTAEEQRLVRELFRQLVTGQGTRSVLSRQEAVEVLGDTKAVSVVLEKLLSARLLVASESPTGDDRIEIIHEALIVAWPRLVTWQREDADSARLRDSLRAAARQWEERGRPSGVLWRKETLTEYRLWRARYAGRLTVLEEAFAQASLKEERRAQTIRRSLAAVAFVTLAVGLIVVLRAYALSDASLAKATVSAAEAKLSVQRLWFEQARLAMTNDLPMEAFVYGSAAEQAGASGEALDHVMSEAALGLEGAVAVASLPLGGMVGVLLVDRDERWVLATSTKEILQLSLPELKVLARWEVRCPNGTLLPDMRHVALACLDNAFRVLNLETGTVETTPLEFKGYSVNPSPNAERFAVGEGPAQVSVRKINGEEISKLDFGPAELVEGSYSPKGDLLVYGGLILDGPLGFHGLRSYRGAKLQWVFETPRLIRHLGFAAGDRAVFATADGVVGAVDLATGKLLWQVPAHAGVVRKIELSADRERMTSVGEDGTLNVWRVATGSRDFQTFVALGVNRCADFLGDRSVLTATSGVVRRVSLRNGKVEFAHHGHGGTIRSCTAVPGHRLYLTGDMKGEVRAWDITKLNATSVTEMEGLNALGAQVSIRGAQGVVRTKSLQVVPIRYPFDNVSDFNSTIAPDDSWGVISLGDRVLVLRRVGEEFIVETQRTLTPRTEQLGAASADSNLIAVPTLERVLVLAKDGSSRFFTIPHDFITNVVFTNTELLAASNSGKLYALSLTDGSLKRTSPAHSGFFYVWQSPRKGKLLTFGMDGKILRLDVGDLEKPDLRLETDEEFTKLPLTESASGSLVALIGRAGVVSVFDWATQKRISRLTIGHGIDQVRLEGGEVTLRGPKGEVSRMEIFPPVLTEAKKRAAGCRPTVELVNDALSKRTHPCSVADGQGRLE